MSPASYRAAPPRVGSCKPYANRTGTPNPLGSQRIARVHGLAVALGVGAAGVLVAPGAGRLTEPEGAAATAWAIAACRRCCAAPYPAKSPFFRAVCPSEYACCIAARAAFNAEVEGVTPAPVPPTAGVVVGAVPESAVTTPELPPKSPSKAPCSVSDHASWLPKAVTIARDNGNEDVVLALT